MAECPFDCSSMHVTVPLLLILSFCCPHVLHWHLNAPLITQCMRLWVCCSSLSFCCPMYLAECPFDCSYAHVVVSLIAPYPLYMYIWAMSSIPTGYIHLCMYGLGDPCFDCSYVYVIASLSVHITLLSPVLADWLLLIAPMCMWLLL